MISRNHKNSCLVIVLLFVLEFAAAIPLNAQQEIPDNVKDLLLEGINDVDSAKVPADIDNALRLFKEVNKAAPEFADVHYYLGRTLLMLEGNLTNSVKEFKKYLELYPDAPDKENVEADIKRVEENLKANRKSALVGMKLMALPDGIYIKSIDKVGHRVSSRMQKFYAGDKILKVNGEDIAGLSLQEVLNKIDSEESGSIKLTIKRTGEPFDISVSKAAYNQMSPYSLRLLGDYDLNTFLKEAEKPVIVLWSADTCTQCRKYYPSLLPSPAGIKTVLVDIEEDKMIGDEFGISKDMIPVVSFYKDGKLFDKITGYDKELLIQKADALRQ